MDLIQVTVGLRESSKNDAVALADVSLVLGTRIYGLRVTALGDARELKHSRDTLDYFEDSRIYLSLAGLRFLIDYLERHGGRSYVMRMKRLERLLAQHLQPTAVRRLRVKYPKPASAVAQKEG